MSETQPRLQLQDDNAARRSDAQPSELVFSHSRGLAQGVGPGRWQDEARFASALSIMRQWAGGFGPTSAFERAFHKC
jgi:hypothetical protein